MQPTTLETQVERFSTPAWVHDAVFYQIFPDRFAISDLVRKPSNIEPWDTPPTLHGYKGGDLVGVREKLDYLQDLGVNAIYLCPVFKSTANHRYHTYDYYEVDPILGGNAALDDLLQDAHGRGMRIILDGVFNHTGRGFFQFADILENGGASPYIDWFTVRSWPLHPYGPADQPSGYDAWWGERALPKLNTGHEQVREFLWDVAVHWIERGIDGWRLDVPQEIDDEEFWREFRGRVKTVNPDAYIVGEIWTDARRWLQGDQFDGVMNYLFTKACTAFFTRDRGIDEALLHETIAPLEAFDGWRFEQAAEALLKLYPWPATLAQLNLLDSHDMTRFLSVARGDESAYRLAMLFMMCFPGAPCVYYGDEIGLAGGQTPEMSRVPFEWARSGWNEGLRQYVQDTIALRKRCAELRTGSYSSVWCDENVYAFGRRLGDRVSICGFNVGAEESVLSFDLPENVRGTEFQSTWGESSPQVVNGRVVDWHLPARSALVIRGRVSWAGPAQPVS